MSDLPIPDPISAATVVLLRERHAAVETLMLRKNGNIDFGGMWVFPGGCIEDADYDATGNADAAARAAAAREAEEETGILLEPDEFQRFAHWTPPPMPRKRFNTWFFAAAVHGDEHVEIDGEEIHDYRWIRPKHALEEQARGNMNVVAPTWVTLFYLSQYASVSALLQRFASAPPKQYQSRAVKLDNDAHAVLWHGDAGYEEGDASLPGERHRLIIQGNQYTFENTIEPY